MLQPINPPKGDRQAAERQFREEVMRLREPQVLKQRLAAIDRLKPLRRIYVMGCGRSGTWLLEATFATFEGMEILPKEVSVEHFGLFTTDQPVLVLKRDYIAYQRIEEVPEEIEIAWVVRHPYDVLTSNNPTTQRVYHIPAHRWLGEMLALQYLVDTGRKNTRIVRYEDLVTRPDEMQADLAAFFRLKPRYPMSDIDLVFKGSPEAVAAMHGLRKIDASSIGKHKSDPEKIRHLRSLQPRIGRVLQWVAETYGYDTAL